MTEESLRLHLDRLPLQSTRTVKDLAGLFSSLSNEDAVVYQTFGLPYDELGPPKLLYGTTVLNPGVVGDEYFMTRGHFHTNPARGELVFTTAGEGELILMDRERNTWTEPMRAGLVNDIDGRHAHRVANTGDTPLVFLVVWMSDCGHDYESILKEGFSKRLVKRDGVPSLIYGRF